MTLQRLEPVRVLFMDHVPRMSGAEQSLADLVAGLAQGPVEPVVCLPSDGPLAAELRAQGILVRMVPMSQRMLETSRETLGRKPLVALTRLLSFLVAGWRVFRLIRDVRPAIVHTNTLKTHLLALLPCKLARVPLVWHMRDILPEGWLSKAMVSLARFVSVVIVPSRAVAAPFKGRKSYRKCRLIPNGVRVEDFQDAKADRSLREAMAVAPSDPVIGIVGRIAPWKGQEVFLRAAGMLAQRYPRAHFAIVGAVLFPENDVPFEQYLHRLVYDLGLEDRVTFLGWQPAPEAMASIDIFVHASMEPEPFGRAIVEAMAAGKPVIAADGGAVREILPPSAGFVVSPGRPDLLADALDRLLEDRKLRKRMGEAGAAIADSFFPVARTVQAVGGLYRSLNAQNKRKAAKRSHQMRKIQKVTKASKRRGSKAQGRPARPAQPSRPSPDEQVRPMLYQDLVREGKAPRFQAPQPQARAIPAERARTRFVEQIEPAPELEEYDDDDLVADDDGDLEVYSPEPDDFRSGPAPRGGTATMDRVAETPVRAPSRAPHVPVRARATAPARRAPVGLPEGMVLPAFAEPADLHFATKPLYDLLKRIMDVSLALAILVVGAPVWLLVAIAIKLESPGAVLHRGTVVGKDSKPFTYYKFRSMRVDGDDSAHRKFIERYVAGGGHEQDGETMYKLTNDDRVTEVGRFIRKLSIDEIPQLINVLKGQMSLVGPRPPLCYEYDLYDDYAKLRLRVLPGITGMQQVWSRDMTAYEHKLKMDMAYIRQRSLWLDVKLILRTIPAALRGH